MVCSAIAVQTVSAAAAEKPRSSRNLRAWSAPSTSKRCSASEKGVSKAGVVEHRGQVEQLGIRLHAEPVGVQLAEEENPPGVVVDQRAGRLLEKTRGFGDRRGLGNLHTCDEF